MTAPLINLYKTKEEAFYFKNSWMNQFFDFSAVQLLPNNKLAYVQITDTPDGINLEDWTVKVVDLCKGTKKDITKYFSVEGLTNASNGTPQLFWSLKNVPFECGYNLQYLEITQAIGETFYSTPFLLTNDESEKTAQLHYKEKRTDTYQSIGFKMWYRTTDKKTELTTYYETSTRNTVTQAIKTNKIDIYKTEQVSIDSLIQLSDILESPYLYVNSIRASLFQALDIPKPTARENYGRMEVQLSLNRNDIYKEVLKSNGDWLSTDWDENDWFIYKDQNIGNKIFNGTFNNTFG
jgi:hypothetical protein